MKEQILRLAKLQRMETEMATTRVRLTDVDRKIAGLDGARNAAESTIAERAEALDGFRKRYREMEMDVLTNEDAVAKKKARLNTLKTNKEYQAMLREIEELQKKNGRLDDEMLVLLDEIEAGETALADARSEAERIAAEVDAAESQIRDGARRDEARLGELADERNSIAAELPADLLTAFEKVRTRVAAPAMVPVVGPSCEGCNMNIPPQTRNELQRFDGLKYCPFCHRIIYWKGA